ncbi:hypothetical protein D3C72_2159250 [compost metagenome]
MAPRTLSTALLFGKIKPASMLLPGSLLPRESSSELLPARVKFHEPMARCVEVFQSLAWVIGVRSSTVVGLCRKRNSSFASRSPSASVQPVRRNCPSSRSGTRLTFMRVCS